MKHYLTMVIALAAACGGASKGSAPAAPPTGPAATAAGDDPATPFDDAALRAALAKAAAVDSCGATPGTTMGDHFAAQRDALIGGGDGGNPVDEAFTCDPHDEGRWECQWSVFARPGQPDPDDPCAEGGSSGYIIIVDVAADGAIVPENIHCNAPG